MNGRDERLLVLAANKPCVRPPHPRSGRLGLKGTTVYEKVSGRAPLGAAQKEPARFNRAAASPKANDGKVKHFPDWSLAQFIDVACEIDLLKPDVKKFSHGLRDFRNYIHPYEQMVSRFTPDEHTAKLCFQVLKAALASVAGERK